MSKQGLTIPRTPAEEAELQNLIANPNAEVNPNNEGNFLVSGQEVSEYTKNLPTEAVKSIAKKFKDGGEFQRARELWNGKTSDPPNQKGGLTNGMWNSVGIEVSKNARGREYTEIMKDLNSTYINSYFSRRVRQEVLEVLDVKNPEILKLAKGLKKNLSKKDLKKIADKYVTKKRIKKGSEDYLDIVEGKGKHLEEFIANEIYDMYNFGPAKVKPAFLKERGALLPAWMEITKRTKTGKEYKKWVRPYEGSLDGTLRL